jgi:hypothetical protein
VPTVSEKLGTHPLLDFVNDSDTGGLRGAPGCEAADQFCRLVPLLQSISDFLDDHEEMIEAVRHDLERGLKNPAAGRGGLTPQQVLRSLVLMRVKSWTYRELRERDHRRIHAAPVHRFLLP